MSQKKENHAHNNVSLSLFGCLKTQKYEKKKEVKILTLHEKGAQQLVRGHRFNLCSQVDVSPHH